MSWRHTRWLVLGVVVLLSLCLLQRPKGFLACHSIASRILHPEWEIAPLSTHAEQELTSILAQTYHFLSSGTQSYVFESKDGRYVIKFFRMSQLIPRPIHAFTPKKLEQKQRNFHLLFNGYKLAFERLRADTGLIYLHLNPSKDLQTTLHLIDRKQMKQEIWLDDVAFVVQEKAELLQDRLNRLQREQKFDELQAARSAFLSLIQRQLQASIADLDDGIEKNYGFVGDRPIHIDVGRIYTGEQRGEYDRVATCFDQLAKSSFEK